MRGLRSTVPEQPGEEVRDLTTAWSAKLVQPKQFTKGSVQTAIIRITAPIVLTNQAVFVSFDQKVWHPADWAGEPGQARNCAVLVGRDGLHPSSGSTQVYVRVSAGRETVLLHAGLITGPGRKLWQR